jgi:hypothetical protein
MTTIHIHLTDKVSPTLPSWTTWALGALVGGIAGWMIARDIPRPGPRRQGQERVRGENPLSLLLRGYAQRFGIWLHDIASPRARPGPAHNHTRRPHRPMPHPGRGRGGGPPAPRGRARRSQGERRMPPLQFVDDIYVFMDDLLYRDPITQELRDIREERGQPSIIVGDNSRPYGESAGENH